MSEEEKVGRYWFKIKRYKGGLECKDKIVRKIDMNIEEAIKFLKKLIIDNKEMFELTGDYIGLSNTIVKVIEILITYVETMQAEFERLEDIEDDRDILLKKIEELKDGLIKRIHYTQELEKDLFENCQNYVVTKETIRDKIKELEKQYEVEKGSLGLRYSQSGLINGKINVLKELLEED